MRSIAAAVTIAIASLAVTGCSPGGEQDSHDVVERNAQELHNTSAEQPSEAELAPGE